MERYVQANARLCSPVLVLAAAVYVLQQRQIGQIYADRWLANHIWTLTAGSIETSRDPAVLPALKTDVSAEMQLQAWTAIVVRTENARLCREVLGGEGVSMRETRVGPRVLFDSAPGTWAQTYERRSGLEWVGYSCLSKQARSETQSSGPGSE